MYLLWWRLVLSNSCLKCWLDCCLLRMTFAGHTVWPAVSERSLLATQCGLLSQREVYWPNSVACCLREKSVGHTVWPAVSKRSLLATQCGLLSQREVYWPHSVACCLKEKSAGHTVWPAVSKRRLYACPQNDVQLFSHICLKVNVIS